MADTMAEEPKRKTVKVVVLGDLGRSPRMQYHALSLANNGLRVVIIANVESTPLAELLENTNIHIKNMKPLVFDHGPKLVRYAAKALWQTLSLLLVLFTSGSCEYILCQNPPAIPTLPVCRFYSLCTRARLIIDWHNYAYSIMALSLPEDHLLLKFSKTIEKWFAQSSNHNFCVTYAMKEDLLQNWNVQATVLYDRPPKIFHPISVQEKHNWFLKLSQKYPEFSSTEDPATQEGTAFTWMKNNVVELRTDRPGLLFSSTSWTEDEDFKILLEALQIYETMCHLTDNLPKLICVITGKGPMKEYYKNLMDSRQWTNVTIITPWLEAVDYPTMVASADLGVCLHTSSSGLDLPMKIVDMFGAGLPVCAVDFLCLDELVHHGENGYIFKDGSELSKQIVSWFTGFPDNQKQNNIVEKMRKELTKFQESRWEDNWNLRVKKYFEM